MAMKGLNAAIWEKHIPVTFSNDATTGKLKSVVNGVTVDTPSRGLLIMVPGTIKIRALCGPGVTVSGENWVDETWVITNVPFLLPRYVERIFVTGTVTITANDVFAGS